MIWTTRDRKTLVKEKRKVSKSADNTDVLQLDCYGIVFFPMCFFSFVPSLCMLSISIFLSFCSVFSLVFSFGIFNILGKNTKENIEQNERKQTHRKSTIIPSRLQTPLFHLLQQHISIMKVMCCLIIIPKYSNIWLNNYANNHLKTSFTRDYHHMKEEFLLKNCSLI